MGRRHDPFDHRSLLGSVGLHLTLLLVVWVAGFSSPEPMRFETIDVVLVSPPPSIQAEEEAPATEEIVIETPDQPPPPEPEPDDAPPVPIEETDDPPPPEEDPKPTEELAEPEDDPTPATTTEEPTPEATESGEDINVRMEGVRRDFPRYYGNIVDQITRCFRWRGGGSWQTTILFFIERDGTADDIDFVRRSGNAAFDFEAMGAVDCAGQGRFGPLPDELPYDRLPIQFDFSPIGDPTILLPETGRKAQVAIER